MKDNKVQEILKEVMEILGGIRRNIEHGISFVSILAVDEAMDIVDSALNALKNKTVYERVQEERDELNERLDKLTACLKKPPKVISTRQLGLLEEQEKAMSKYLFILNQRLEEFKEQGEK